ncbi:MAG: glycosyltransferase family 25 protein [Gemmobacter sp.]
MPFPEKLKGSSHRERRSLARLARVINLDRSADRLAAIGARLDAAEIPWQRQRSTAPVSVHAAHAHHLYRGTRARTLFGRDLSLGEIGCCLSHVEILRAEVEHGDPLALVLEDDALPTPDAVAFLRALSAWLLTQGGSNVSVLHVSRSIDKWSRPLATVAGNEVIRTYRPPLICSAILWTRSGMTTLLARIALLGMDRPVDDAVRACFCRAGAAAALRQPLFAEHGFSSTINNAMHCPSGLTKVARMRWKVSDYGAALFNLRRGR